MTLGRERGFTILEVVFAVSILAIGILGYASLKVSNRYSWFYAKNLSQAVQLTKGNLEGLLLAGYHDTGWMSAGDHSVVVNADGSTTQTNGESESGLEAPVSSGDFSATGVRWTVLRDCPSELSKMVIYTTEWGNKEVSITQVQVRP